MDTFLQFSKQTVPTLLFLIKINPQGSMLLSIILPVWAHLYNAVEEKLPGKLSGMTPQTIPQRHLIVYIDKAAIS